MNLGLTLMTSRALFLPVILSGAESPSINPPTTSDQFERSIVSAASADSTSFAGKLRSPDFLNPVADFGLE